MHRLFLFTIPLLAALSLAAQDQCPLPPSPFSGERNIFTPQQEMYLGEVMAEQEERDWRLIDDDELNARLQRVGESLLRHLPETGVKYRFRLIDMPLINAFSNPGGRVYVTRKMVAFLNDDNELAALLAHEIGHSYTHQQAIDFTRLLHEKLAVDSLGDRDDVRRQFNALLDQWRRKVGAFDHARSAKEQVVADQLGLYAMARAGYPPAVMAPFFDRLADTHGKTGNFLSDIFGATSEDSRRLRDLLRNTAVMPSGCVDTPPQSPADSFKLWQQRVIAYSPSATSAAKDVDFDGSLIRKSVLNPPLQDDFRQVRFSPNGKYLLVQDGSGITVLARDPLTALFRIPEPDATSAGFSPDSSAVVFYTPSLRVERWSIAEKKQISAREILERKRCVQSALAPDGNSFACFDNETSLKVFDVNSGGAIYEKKNFANIDWWAVAFEILGNRGLDSLQFINLEFDLSSRILIAASHSNAIALDLGTHKLIPLPGALKSRLTFPFTFLSSNRLALLSPQPGIYEFPSGKLISAVPLGGRSIEHVEHGNLVILRPVQKHAVGVYDLDQHKIIAATDKQAVDAYDDVLASQGRDGKLLLGIWTGKGWEQIAGADLPRPEIGRLQAVAVSADMNWLAFSLRDRGAIYQLDSSQRSMFLRGFRGAYFVSGPALLADYPKKDEVPRTIAKMDLQHRSAESDRTLSEGVNALQIGPFLVLRKPQKPGGPLFYNATVEVQDVITGEVIFTQHFSKSVPALFLDPESHVMVFASGVSSGAAETSLAADLQSVFSWPDEKKSIYELQVVDLISRARIRDIHIDSGKFSFTIRDLAATADYLALNDSENRVQLYSMKTGQQIGSVFGGPAYLSPSGLMSVVSQKGKIDVYDCATLKKIRHYEFPSAAIYSHISKDGERLMVLTADQTAYELRVRDSADSAVQAASR